MNIKARALSLHRWIGLFIALQLLAWSIGGFLFSWLPPEEINGEIVRLETKLVPPTNEILNTPQAILASLPKAQAQQVVATTLRQRRGRWVYELSDANGPRFWVDAHTGQPWQGLSPEEAGSIARNAILGSPSTRSVRRFDHKPPLEYRGKALPAYRIILDGPHEPHVYVHAISGEVTAVRTDSWRLYDFFWMLHIMDYSERSDYRSLLLQLTSLVAFLSSISGVLLWGFRGQRRWVHFRRRFISERT